MLIHDAVLECLTCGDTQISASNLPRLLKELGEKNSSGKTGFENQFSVSLHDPHSHTVHHMWWPPIALQTLEQVSPNPHEVKATVACSHPEKNRSMQFLPGLLIDT